MILKWVKDNIENRENPEATLSSKTLQGTRHEWGYRIGNHRILASVLENELVIDVVRVGHRQGACKRMPKDL